MTSNELRELAEVLSVPLYHSFGEEANVPEGAADYLRACADAMEAGPVAWTWPNGEVLSDDQTDPMWKQDDAVALYPLAIPAQPVSVADELTPAIPQGWRMVPVEPTPEMVLGGEAEIERHDFLRLDHAYRAMLDAAPTPPVAAQ